MLHWTVVGKRELSWTAKLLILKGIGATLVCSLSPYLGNILYMNIKTSAGDTEMSSCDTKGCSLYSS